LALETPQGFYARLMAVRRGEPNEETLARILASLFTGVGAMPTRLGLSEEAFRDLMQTHFPGFDLSWRSDHRQSPAAERAPEMDDLRKLLMANRTGNSASEPWMVDIVMAGCLGNQHLWQDLGLCSRTELSRLMQDNFAPLARANVMDMKWKKFLYKQLCEAEAVYVCRAPSCEACADYQQCFGPEE
jgi:nitrogen fixation protein NifQ